MIEKLPNADGVGQFFWFFDKIKIFFEKDLIFCLECGIIVESIWRDG